MFLKEPESTDSDSWYLYLGRAGRGKCRVQSFGQAGLLPGCSIFADRFFLLRFVNRGVQTGEGIPGFICFSGFQPLVELLEAGSQTASVAAICATVLKTLSMCLEGRCMIGHPEQLL